MPAVAGSGKPPGTAKSPSDMAAPSSMSPGRIGPCTMHDGSTNEQNRSHVLTLTGRNFLTQAEW